MALLSVIVPCYNVEDTLQRCLTSLVNQSQKDIKIIVVDDGSTDHTANIINQFKEAYPQIECITKENGGISSARNVGLQAVDTPYFGFIDSDDYVEEDMFEKMLNQIMKNDSDICVCDFIWEWPNKKKYQKEANYLQSSEMITKQMATLWNKIYKTALVTKLHLDFPEGYRYEDAYFLYCLASHDLKICFVHEYFVHYVQREGSITHTNNEKVMDMIVVFDKIKEYYIKQNKSKMYYGELEFLFAKFFLGNSFLRACQIKNEEHRNEILEVSWNQLIDNYPNFKNNPYLKQFGFAKRTYYQLINKKNYKWIGKLLFLGYQLKKGV